MKEKRTILYVCIHKFKFESNLTVAFFVPFVVVVTMLDSLLVIR